MEVHAHVLYSLLQWTAIIFRIRLNEIKPATSQLRISDDYICITYSVQNGVQRHCSNPNPLSRTILGIGVQYTCVLWTPWDQPKVSRLLRCPDFPGQFI